MAVKELTGGNFDAFVKKNEVSIVDFHADWCGPCHVLRPLFKALSEELKDKKVAFGELNVDGAREKTAELGVTSIPMMIIFKKGKPAERMAGALSKKAIMEKLEKFIK